MSDTAPRALQLASPPSDSGASGRFVLRLDAGLHAALRAAAIARGISLNLLCARTLAAHAFDAADDGLRTVVQAAVAAFRDELVGVVAFGSWARGEAMQSPDIDVLLVLAPGSAITRGLYRRLDNATPSAGGRIVDAHIVALPAGAGASSAFWSEVARDGIVLFDSSHRLARHLGAVRRCADRDRRITTHERRAAPPQVADDAQP